jgi:hypothetical protein
MKGLFIPGITAKMFRDACLETIETLMTEGAIYDINIDIDYGPAWKTITRKARTRKAKGIKGSNAERRDDDQT